VFANKPPSDIEGLNDQLRLALEQIHAQELLDILRNFILVKGVILLREKINKLEGATYVTALTDTWTSFYRDMLGNIEAIFWPLQEAVQQLWRSSGSLLVEPSIRFESIKVFRDVMLNAPARAKIQSHLETTKASPALLEMLFVAQGIRQHDEEEKLLQDLIVACGCPFLRARSPSMPSPSLDLDKHLTPMDCVTPISQAPTIQANIVRKATSLKFTPVRGDLEPFHKIWLSARAPASQIST
jgi:hypothetical protein